MVIWNTPRWEIELPTFWFLGFKSIRGENGVERELVANPYASDSEEHIEPG